MFSLLKVNTRKSFRRILLPHFVAVSPLGAHSYKKIGGRGIRVLPALSCEGRAANGTGDCGVDMGRSDGLRNTRESSNGIQQERAGSMLCAFSPCRIQ